MSLTTTESMERSQSRWVNWPRDPANGRLLCAPAHPMPKDAPKDSRWAHTNIETVRSDSDFRYGTEWDTKRCKDCGVEWDQEVPQ